MENEVVPVSDVKYDLTLARAPKQVLAEAIDASKALKAVVSSRKDAVIFNGKQYLTFEDYQTLGRFYGITTRIVSTEYIEIGGARGFVARAEAISTANGMVVSSAEAMCLNDEKNWEKKPLFQLRSMSQTRAGGKSLRNVLAWVAVLAGYDPSLAEEMTGDEGHRAAKPPVSEPKLKPEQDAPSGNLISDGQRKRFYAIWKSAGKTEDEVKQKLTEAIGVADSAQIPRDKYDALCAWAEGK